MLPDLVSDLQVVALQLHYCPSENIQTFQISKPSPLGKSVVLLVNCMSVCLVLLVCEFKIVLHHVLSYLKRVQLTKLFDGHSVCCIPRIHKCIAHLNVHITILLPLKCRWQAKCLLILEHHISQNWRHKSQLYVLL